MAKKKKDEAIGGLKLSFRHDHGFMIGDLKVIVEPCSPNGSSKIALRIIAPKDQEIIKIKLVGDEVVVTDNRHKAKND